MSAILRPCTEPESQKISLLVYYVRMASCKRVITKRGRVIGAPNDCLRRVDVVADSLNLTLPVYSLVSSNGPIKLSDDLTEQLVQGLRVARSIEKEMQTGMDR